MKKTKTLLILLLSCFLVASCGSVSTETPDASIGISSEMNTEKETKETSAEKNSSENEVASSEQNNSNVSNDTTNVAQLTQNSVDTSLIPQYSGNAAYVVINENVPYFSESEKTTEAFEYYSELDSLGRCGVAYANVCTEIMPTEERGSIGSVKPTGWQTIKYDIVDGKYLYNRCHLIGFQLSGENANNKNLITGTRYMNVDGMLPFENMVADYVKETNNHVLYRVTPVFTDNNLVADGVLMEAMSVEDNGEGILFNVFCYNIQPGVSIDYSTGNSSLTGEVIAEEPTTEKKTEAVTPVQTTIQPTESTTEYVPVTTPAPTETEAEIKTIMVHITETGSKYHNAGCRYLKSDITVSLEQAKASGLTPCSVCNPPQ